MKRETKLQPYLIRPYQGDSYKLTYIIDNADLGGIKYLEDTLVKNECEIFKCWQSKFDRQILEIREPKVYDVYNCIIYAIGSLKSLKKSIFNYDLRNKNLVYLEKCLGEPILLEEDKLDYKSLAYKILGNL